MTKIKLCGQMRPEDIDYANEAGPDYIGFIFAENRKRTISVETAVELKKRLSPDIKAVGVFLNQSLETIKEVALSGSIDVIQLHGSEDDEFIMAVKETLQLPVIKAFRIDSAQDLLRAEKSPADMVLLDNGIGGTGESFNWECLRDFHRDFFLAGGLDAENVKEAIKAYAPFGVDVSSGVETDGFKDRGKVIKFVQTVRSLYNK